MGSDRVLKRAATSNVAMNVRDKYQRAKFELDGLAAARCASERLGILTAFANSRFARRPDRRTRYDVAHRDCNPMIPFVIVRTRVMPQPQ